MHFFSLPMRNWNENARPIFWGGEIVFSLPMRNWNWSRCSNGSRRLPFSAYLWGIETLFIRPGWRLLIRFSAYLWGIETIKPFRASFLHLYSFQPTYEELKQIYESCNSLLHHCFQPTYEELKRDWDSGWSCHICVFSLPMRNWNFITPPFKQITIFVFSLPMRNWNLYPGQPAEHRRAVFSLPMRNWNPCRAVGFSVGFRVFSLPMRNWNQNPLFRVC